jgi:hypothetical protein
MSYQLQGVGKWQTGNVYSAGSNYFRIYDQLNSIERLKIQNTGQIDTLGWITELNTLTGITGTSISALTYNSFTNNFTFNSGITTSASVLTIGLLTDNILNYSGANTINATSYNTSSLLRNNFTFGSAAASVTYTQATGIRALANVQNQYIQNGANSGTISHYANIQILGDQKTGAGLTTFTNRYGLLINDYNEFTAGNTYTNRWGIYQAGLNESNFFAGKVGIGSGYSPGTFQLDVIGTTRLTGTVTVAGNTNFSNQITIAGGLGILSSTGFDLNSSSDILITQTNGSNGGFRVAINNGGPVNNVFKIFYSNNALFQSGGTFTDTASSQLTVTSTTKGFLPPRMTTTQKNAITTPAAGLVIYDTTLNKLCVYTTAWETVTSI